MVARPLGFIFPTNYALSECDNRNAYYVGVETDEIWDSTSDSLFLNPLIPKEETEIETLDDLFEMDGAIGSNLIYRNLSEIVGNAYLRSIDGSSTLMIGSSIEIMENDVNIYNSLQTLVVGIMLSNNIPFLVPPRKVGNGNYPTYKVMFMRNLFKEYFKIDDVS